VRSVRRKVVAGLAGIALAFAALTSYSIVLHRQTVEEVRLINNVYLTLTIGTAEIRSTQLVFNTLLDRLGDEHGRSVTREWIDAARRFRPITLRRLTYSLDTKVGELSAQDERLFIEEMRNRLRQVERRYIENEARFAQVYLLLDTGKVDEARQQIEALKRTERLLDRVLAGVGREVDRHITWIAKNAQLEGSRASLGLAFVTAAAFLFSLVVALWIHRLLRPLSSLGQAVERVARGDLEVRVEIERDDELGALAAGFNHMTAALAERDQRLIRSERLATAGKMAAQVTHEIRNPLSSLGLNAELLEDELVPGQQGDEARALLKAMQDEIERLRGITESYLRFARLPQPSPEYGSLNQAVDAALTFMASEIAARGIEIEKRLEERLGDVLFDVNQIRQALVNLLRNACEAMPEGGKLLVQTEVASDAARIVLSDTGPGVPSDKVDTIFESFYSTKSGGTGLGLPLVRQICLAHGGEIHYEAKEGWGGTFAVTLPMSASAR
jgi:signal transduction histidine kinase